MSADRHADRVAIDLIVDFNSEDDTGLSWTYANTAKDPSRIVPGRYVVAGMTGVAAVVRIVDVDADGLVHVLPVAGSVEVNPPPSRSAAVHGLTHRDQLDN